MKQILLSAAVLLGVGLQAQVGINTDAPTETLDVNGTAKVQNIKDCSDCEYVLVTDGDGVIKKVLKSKLNAGSATSTSNGVSISDIAFVGEYVAGVALSSANKVQVTLKNNSLFEIKNVEISDALTLQNPSGGNVSIQSSKLVGFPISGGGKGFIEYTLTGTPVKGALTATFDKLGLTKEQTRNVGLGSATISNVKDYIVSFTFSNPAVEYQGELPNDYVVKIPYAAGAKGSYEAYTSPVIETALGENNDKKQVKLEIEGGRFNPNGGYIEAKVIVTGGAYRVKKEQVPGKEYTAANFKNVEIGGSVFNVEIKGIAGVPDRLFGKPTNGKLEHQFIYLPIKGPDGKIWLNNNLGADYANINKKDVFNPSKQASSRSDYHAYGNYFQWGRDANDGYELMNWTGSQSGSPVHGNKPWYSNSQLTNTAWDPCPEGYRLPTIDELSALRSAIGSNPNYDAFASSSLKLPAPYWRYDSYGSLITNYVSRYGYYWSSTPNGGSNAKYLHFGDSGSGVSNGTRSYGFSVRCLKK